MEPTRPPHEWIGCAIVAAEMSLTERQAWQLVKRLGVPVIEAYRATAKSARFLRSHWIEARDRSAKPAPTRAPYRKSFAPPPPPKVKPVAKVARDKLAELRRA